MSRSAAVAGVLLLETGCGSDPAGPLRGTGGSAGSGAADAGGDPTPPPNGGAAGSGGQGGGGLAPAGGTGSGMGGRGGARPVDTCGDGRATGLEACDGADLRGATCSDLGFDGGELLCDPNRCLYDAGGCKTEVPEGVCGNGKVEPGEACDGADFGGHRCEDIGGISGTLSCTTTCVLDANACKPAVCGDGIAGSGEACDGADLHGMDCTKLGYPSGTLACKKGACSLDDSNCERCGDGLIEDGEACDGSTLGQTTCRSLGFSGGHLACATGCKLDTHACARCGDGTVEGGENCDGAELGGATCVSLGLPTGKLGCASNCLYDVTGCAGTAPRCGNGIAEPGEECDGKDLTGLDCSMFGKDGGTLACAPTCRFDTTGCTEPPPQDSCRDCRELRCGVALEACQSNAACLAILGCMKKCETSIDDYCFFHCGDDKVAGLSPALTAFACTTTVCVDECGGSL